MMKDITLLERALLALREGARTIKAWHGEVGWEQYQRSPEMKLINNTTEEIELELDERRRMQKKGE